jgi:hypothetical protein
VSTGLRGRAGGNDGQVKIFFQDSASDNGASCFRCKRVLFAVPPVFFRNLPKAIELESAKLVGWNVVRLEEVDDGGQLSDKGLRRC